jgi:hypothetical protein
MDVTCLEEYTTTAADFKVFARNIEKWQALMGLTHWSIFVQHKDDDDDDDDEEERRCTTAWVLFDYETMVANVCLGVTWPIKPTKKLLEMAAFHECCHIWFAPLVRMVKQEYMELGAEEEHRIIVMLERLMFGKALSECGV